MTFHWCEGNSIIVGGRWETPADAKAAERPSDVQPEISWMIGLDWSEAHVSYRYLS